MIPSIWKSAYVLPLLKGGEPSVVYNYRSICKLCVLAKVLEKLVNNHSTSYLCDNLSDAVSHFYADDTVIYCSLSSVLQFLEFLQSAFYTVQSCLTQLKLVLNADKSKTMLFSNGKQLSSHLSRLSTVQGVAT